MKRMLLWLNAIFILCSSSPAQNSTDVPGIDTLASRVKLFGETLPQEKVYLHIDNTCYFVGDTIWYKGYVTRSDKGTLTYPIRGIAHAGRLSGGTPATGNAGRHGTRCFSAHRLPVRWILRTARLYALDAELRPLRASSLSLHRRDVL